MRHYDPNAALIPIVAGTYKLVNGGEPLERSHAVVGTEDFDGVRARRLYWVEQAVNRNADSFDYQPPYHVW
jgi:hypothetical protein